MHFSKILIACDITHPTFESLELIAADKKWQGSEIILLYVHRLFEAYYIDGVEFVDPRSIDDYNKKCQDKAFSKLKEIAGKYLQEREVRYEVIISKKGIAEEICAFAEKENCDLIVMGTRGHTVVGTIFVGSTVHRVLLMTKCPVLIVPPEENNLRK